jgi:hypothetical protein
MRDLAATGGMTDMDGVVQVQVRGKRREVAGVMIHIVSLGHLARSTVAAPIMRNDTETLAKEEQHLRIPVIRRERPTMRKHQRLSGTPVFVEDLSSVSDF